MSVTDQQYLVLSSIAYTDFNMDGPEQLSDKGKTIGELIANDVIKLNPEEGWTPEVLASVKDYKLMNFQNNNGSTGSGFAGCAFESPSGDTVFAFRGTEFGSINDIVQDMVKTDIEIALGLGDPTQSHLSIFGQDKITKQFQDATQFVAETLIPGEVFNNLSQAALDLAVLNNNVTFTGHSLGGGASILFSLPNTWFWKLRSGHIQCCWHRAIIAT